MANVRLGRTGLIVNKNGFGALPVQRRSVDDAVRILHRALDGGVDFFDTARVYSDSEEKLGLALGDARDRIILATKTAAKTGDGLREDLQTSLRLLKTDHIDIYQFHNPSFCPRPGDGSGLYEAMLEARAQGRIRFIGITNHSREIALEAAESGLYDTVQFPFSYISSAEDVRLVETCAARDVGFICMKALAGGLITNARAAYAYMARFPGALPIWGIQHMRELEEFLACDLTPPVWDEQMAALIEKEKAQLAGDFCRGCGYCMPCPAGIEISTCARIVLMIRRSPSAHLLSPEWQAKMQKINECLHCGHCAAHCPYHLDTPSLLKKNLAEYETILRS